MPADFFRISIWQAVRPGRPMQLHSDAGTLLTDLSGLSEEIYRWDAPLYAWPAFGDAGTALQQEFRSSFAADKAPSARSIAVLVNFLERLEAEVPGSVARGPMPTTSDDDDENEAPRCFGGVALANHLRWVCDTFQGAPGVSVLVR